TVEDPDVRAAAEAGAGDDIGHAIAGEIAGGHAHAAGEAGVIGVEAHARAGGIFIKDAHDRPAAGLGAGGQGGGGVAAGGADAHQHRDAGDVDEVAGGVQPVGQDGLHIHHRQL